MEKPLTVYENGNKIARARDLDDAKKLIAGLDLSMATVDCDPQAYRVTDVDGAEVYSRPRIFIP